MRPLPSFRLATIFAYAVSISLLHAVEFSTQIKPILEANCLSCHNSNIQKGDLSLSTAAEARAYSPSIWDASNPAQSLLLKVISSSNDSPPEMPKDGAPLSQPEVKLIQQWITEGAKWPSNITLKEPSKAGSQWWAYQPLPPRTEFTANSIDAFINAQLATHDLAQNAQADRRTLIRRASYDLIGLPPTSEEVEAFVADTDPRAYENLIDRLLASPHYGERWGRHWLDVVRFGESNGYERNVIINNLWPFRDYVIQSLNQDKPFDRFIREHLAGDVLGKGQPEIEIGTAFLVAGPYDDVGNQDAVQAAQIRANTLDEMIRATSEAFLGLTVGCARCHDHKFDPISQADYYRLYATFAAIRHGSVEWATPTKKTERQRQLSPLEAAEAETDQSIATLEKAILERAEKNIEEHQSAWIRPAIQRTGTEDRVSPTTAQYIRLVSEGQDSNPLNKRNFNVDEFEIWSTGANPRNLALASNGAKAFGEARRIEDFANAYDAGLAIDGQFGARFIATGGTLTIQLPTPQTFERILFSSARGADKPDQGKFSFVGEYRIEVSNDGQNWTKLVDSHDRKPASEAIREHRLRQSETTPAERKRLATLRQRRQEIKRQIGAVPKLPTAFLGKRSPTDGQGPFHIFQGGDPQRKGDEIIPASLSVLKQVAKPYQLDSSVDEGVRRASLANWITHPDTPLTPRVLANRVWHYHFGTGLVDTPSDFGYMGGRPSHPELLDYLARELVDSGWRLKPLHRLIMLSKTYRQSSAWHPKAAAIDANSRTLWRFPPRRLSAEEIRDTMLLISGRLDRRAGGPGFRLYKFMQDNVSTYEPLDQHGPETYRRAVYHQNVRASVVDLMTDFDLPDCAFSTPRRAGTTTPLQALTLMNHQFTVDMANAFASLFKSEPSPRKQVRLAFQQALQREPDEQELESSVALIKSHGLSAFARALLNANELIYLD